MTSRSFSSALAVALSPHPMDVFGAPGHVPAPKQQLFHNAIEFLVLIDGSAPRIC
jgi:hypothetical protein